MHTHENLSQTDGGTDRTPAQRRSLTNEATAITGIPLLDSLSLIPDTAGSLLTAPAPISHAEAATILAGIWSEVLVDLPAILRKVNPATTRSGRRPRKVTELFASADYVATLPTARTNHGSAIHAAFQAQDADLRSFHGTARQTPLTPYQEARIAVAARRAQRALARLAANQGADW